MEAVHRRSQVVEEFIEVDVLQILRDIVGASRLAAQERGQQRSVDPMILSFALEVVEDFVEMYPIISKERISERNVEQIVDVLNV